MMVASSAVSPLCTWLVAACMSSSSENKHFNEFSNYFQYQKKLRRRGNLVALTTNKNRGRIQLSRARDSDEEKSAVATETLIKSKKRRVVVTGLGVVSPLGHDVDEFYGNILQGISGVTQIEAFDSTQFPTRIAGEIKSFSADGFISKKIAKRADKYMLYLIAAGKKALADGKMRDDVMQELDKGKCGIVIGSALGGMKVFSDGVEALRVSHKKMNPFSVPFATTNMGSAILAMDLGWMGPNYSISAACATSNICILNAANHIIRGETDVMLCGGSDSPLIPIGIGGFSACGILSRRNDEPTKASRPWDMQGDGLVIGEGAGVLLLEELEHAKRRGATIYAEFLGGSFTYHTTHPLAHGEGCIRCMETALVESGVDREDINYINAHAASTPAFDLAEYQSIIHLFGQNTELRMNSTKSMIGHLLGAAGAVEAIATIKAIEKGWIHPNINLEHPIQGVDSNVLVGHKKERLVVKVALSNSFGFGGHSSSILFSPCYKN
ncbi:3-oxoacyl-[acyl-carrier-protein] synthase II, chloroplastic-like [Salvia miltiorrhiza]|uniref:3-oxoacyl-[acyl-carrier-protein] synthase II, chloroplastic-like n=1 Tax=Salvia miltiorrhiza TaxID=226208 RepID=UPI0025AD7E10|nr:3-oxoacyl-[acyl-carrier-protein] synthase II, chloroplastic-like [Salvia miltiorrhiza]XP_057770839.1 3-oxoacyl-[acyl-carrier-protein] synthase II, chloroplastic-like [Salvia miltiorrhiza]XP_057770846.1 3-oxoacyl-[acyl-carrier-protein] synthase II, chloroplastic-like [Salvia miltiorrhiza]XP_057770850.1 3-oxoacyl-[acyl-carrier-protein] synthase II, chloroplastic-like [Salvia miltiorrhiza]